MTKLDPIDELVADWSRQRPDLDFASMGLFARLNRFVALSLRQIDANFQDQGMTTAEFDVLAALRRSGPPFMLKPSVLARSLMLTPAGVTNRIDKLEAQGYVTREVSQDDRRVAPIRLTKSGMKSVDALLERHLQREDQLFEALTPAQRRQLEQIMRGIGDPS
jgi:DNA-binding MarR family transcriptional regulator